MLSKKLRKILIGVILGITLFTSVIAKASSLSIPAFKLSPTSIIYQNQVNHTKGKILIYHTHSQEKNVDSTVIDIGNDLARKLRFKGWDVEHITDDFIQGDYNNAYYHSRTMLRTKDLSQYALCVDIHIDAANNPITTKIKDKDVSSLMFVTTSENPNLLKETQIINGIKDKMSEFSNTAIRDQTTHYKKGISYYNLDLSPNMVLLEVGGDKNTYLQCQYSNTFLAASINNYLSNSNN